MKIDSVCHLSINISGPFNFELGGSTGSLPKLHLNPYSWSKVNEIGISKPLKFAFVYNQLTENR